MIDDRHDPSRATPPTDSGPAIAGVTLAALIIAGSMAYAFTRDRPATTATGFQPVIDDVRPVLGTTGQGGGGR